MPADEQEPTPAGGDTGEGAPEKRPPAPPEPDEAPDTAQDDPAEPAGDQDAGNESEIEEATERPDAFDDAGESQDPLAQAQGERDRYLDMAKRAQADFENYRKRAAKETAAAGQRARGDLVRELIPVVDNLERALGSAAEGEQHLAEGVRLVHADLINVLERNGVEQFDPQGEPFDPSFHEALSTRSQDGAGPGVVLDVVEKGYRTNGTVLRPARVVVSG